MADTIPLYEMLDGGVVGWANGPTGFSRDDVAPTTTAKLTGALKVTTDLVMTEQAAQTLTPVAGYGYVWVKNTAPSTLMFTDDAGSDFTIGSTTGVDTSGVPVALDFARFTDSNTIEGRSYAETKSDLAIVEADIGDLGTLTAMVADNLSVFAATTSAQLAGVISDETGTGALVFADSPVFTTQITTPQIVTAAGIDLTLAPGTTGNVVASTDLLQVTDTGASVALQVNGNTTSWPVYVQLADSGTVKGGLVLDRVTPVITGSTENDTVLFAAAASSSDVHIATESTVRMTVDSTGNVSVVSPGTLTADSFVGALTGNADTVTTITGLAPDTATTAAAQPNITSLGTLTTLTVDDITINGNTISSAGASTLAITPTAGQAITFDGTVTLDAGVITGATSIASTVIELGHATDTTIARSAAGTVTIEGDEVITSTATQTLTNKSLGATTVTGDLSVDTISDYSAGDLTLNPTDDVVTLKNVGIGTTAPQSLLDVQGPVGTGATCAGILTLATKELTIVDGDQLGRIDFNSPLATAGGDAILAGAAIWAEADATFSATVNNTELVFGTATTSAAVERMRIDSAGNLAFAQASSITTAAGDLTLSPVNNLRLAPTNPSVYLPTNLRSDATTNHWYLGSGSTGSINGNIEFQCDTYGTIKIQNNSVGTQSAHSFVLHANSTTGIDIDTSGNVDIPNGDLSVDTITDSGGGDLTLSGATGAHLHATTAIRIGSPVVGTDQWVINSASGGGLYPDENNGQNLGTPSKLIKNGYFGTAVQTPSITTATGDLTLSPAGEIDIQNTVGSTAQTATGDGTTTIDWTAGNNFHFQFGAFNETFTFSPAPSRPSVLTLRLIQDSVGSRTATWPATVQWSGGTAPTLTTTATTGTDLITFYFDGTNYVGDFILDLQ